MFNEKRKQRIGILILFVICSAFFFQSCDKSKKAAEPELKDCEVIHEPEFGGVYIKKTIDEFNALGFRYGDSVDIIFSNGYTMEDIPYYNGYYTETGSPLLVAYPGYDYIKAAINNGEDLWDVAGLPADGDAPLLLWSVASLDEEDTVTVRLNKSGKYLDIQDARDIHYKDDRELFDSDEMFANFRSVSAGNISKDTLYRSASPCDNQHNRAGYVNDLIEEAGITCILDLADSDQKIEGYIGSEDFDSPYFLSLYEDGKVIPIALNMNFTSEEFRAKIASGLISMSEQEGPYLVHCTEGKDRTGFVCVLLEALCGASYEEIEKDYMTTYYNYYRITEKDDKYGIIVESVLDPMIRVIAGDEDIKKTDLSVCAERFLKNAGMSVEQILELKMRLQGTSGKYKDN